MQRMILVIAFMLTTGCAGRCAIKSSAVLENRVRDLEMQNAALKAANDYLIENNKEKTNE